jgi:tRNA threonylcarbamoyl adenosine modification protein YeaZ
MIIFSVDAGFKNLSFAIYKDNEKISYIENLDNRSLSLKFLQMFDQILNISNLKIEDIDKFVISSGPSSFTAIRIEFASIFPFIDFLNKEVFTISPLLSMAYKFYKFSNYSHEIISLIDAKNDQIFVGKYKFYYNEDKIEYATFLEDKAIYKYEIGSIVSPNSIFISNDIEFIKKNFNIKYFNENIISSADILSEIYINHSQNFSFDKNITILPKYLKKSQAEVIKEKKNEHISI